MRGTEVEGVVVAVVGEADALFRLVSSPVSALHWSHVNNVTVVLATGLASFTVSDNGNGSGRGFAADVRMSRDHDEPPRTPVIGCPVGAEVR
ncbi:MAG TPA: hypothetical protein VGW38_16070 [Chloroflexota bacterium]|nr:hypothetical protein [Chloroflexota bacterium]